MTPARWRTTKITPASCPPKISWWSHSNAITASQLCWKPYLHNPSLPHTLARVDTSTLIVWGNQDAIIPVECGHLFQQAIPGSQLRIIDNCGHSPAVEKRGEFVAAVTGFLNSL